MRKWIIDTDTGSDDAVALMMAVAQPDVKILGITTVGGNISLKQATLNALQVLEETNREIPVYMGANRPLCRNLITAQHVHGKDGMGDRGLIHPALRAQTQHAVDFILQTVAQYPDEVEIVALGPVTNLALAIQKDPQTMRKIKRIWSMGTAGFGAGNITPVAEFNVYVDAESYQILLESKIPLTIIGFDLCLGEASFTDTDCAELSQSRMGGFAVQCNTARRADNLQKTGVPFVDLPDAVAMAVALWPQAVTQTVDAHCYCCTVEEPIYGQVIIDPSCAKQAVNATIVCGINPGWLKQKLKQALASL